MIDEFAAEDRAEAQALASASPVIEAEDFSSSEAQVLDEYETDAVADFDEDELEESVMVLEEVDVALVLPVWEPTGDAQVDSALEQLATLDELSVHDHAEVLTSVHSGLHQRLTDISA